MFPTTSRYYSTPTATYVTPAGKSIVYLTRRFVPPGSGMTLLATYLVKKDDRLDNVTAQFLTDPTQFWRVADANDGLRPEDLTAPDRENTLLRIPLPQGN